MKWFLRQAAEELPLPPSALPLAVAAKLSESQLLDVLHLKPMTTSTWISFITKNPKLLCDPHLAPAILLHLSAHSGSLSNSDWKKLKKATTCAPCVPTTRGMRTPAEAYLPSCKARELARVALDVEPDHHTHDRLDRSREENEPTVVCLDSSDSDDEGGHELPRRVSARFLIALGVHALPPLSVLLQQTTKRKGERQRRDSNILQTLMDQAVDAEGLKEIAQNAFIHCVRNPPVTRAADEPTRVMCRPTEATLPNPLWDRQPAVNIVDLRRMCAHGEGLKARQYVRLMVELGVRRVPPIAVMLKCCQGGRPAFRFFVRSLGTYGTEFRPNSVQVPFLPGSTNLYQSDADNGNISQQQHFLPNNVFSQPNPFGAVLQSWVAEEAASAGVTLRQLGVRPLPKFQQILDTLVSRPPSAKAARGVFEWLADRALDGVTPQLSRVMSESPFIPVSDGRVLPPNEVFVSALSPQSRKQLAPKRRKHRRACKRTATDEEEDALEGDVALLHRDPDLLRGLVAVVDFGAEANAFLCRVCGVNTSPSPKQVACLLVNRRDAWMEAHGDSVAEYNELLRQYVAPTVALLDKPTRKKLCAAPILLAQRNHSPDKAPDASTSSPSRTAGPESVVQFARASDIVIADDPNLAALLNPLVPASQHIEVEQLYRALGSKWLSVGCTVVSRPRGRPRRTARSKEVAERLRQRWPLLIHDNRRNMLAGITPAKAEAIEGMRCFEVDAIEMMVTFRNQTKAFRDAASAPSVSLEGGDRHLRINVSAAAEGIFWGEISKELAKFLLGKKCSADRLRYLTLDLNCKLSQPLNELRRAGVRVDGLMHQQSRTQRLQTRDRPEQRAPASASSGGHVDDGVEHIEDFGPGAREFDHDLKKLLRGQRMRQGRLDHSREQSNVSMNECRTRIDLKLSKHSTLAASVPFFIDSSVDQDSVTEKVLEHANELATILSTVAKAMSAQVAKSVHVYLDTRGAQVAYNNNGALFFNLRYYMQVHKRGRKRVSMREIAYYWYVTLCHELAHNTESLHNLAHESCMEQLIATYLPRTMDAIDQLAQRDRTRKRAADGLAASSSGGGGPAPHVKRKKPNRTSPINVSSPPHPTECIDLT